MANAYEWLGRNPGRRGPLVPALAVIAVAAVAGWWLTRENRVVTLQPEHRPSLPAGVAVRVDTEELLSVIDVVLEGQRFARRGDPSWQAFDGDGDARWINPRRHWDEFDDHRVARDESLLTARADAEPFRVETTWRVEGRRVVGEVTMTALEAGRVGPVVPMRLFLTDVPSTATCPARRTGGSPETGGIHWEVMTRPLPGEPEGRYARVIHFTNWVAVASEASSAELVITLENATEPVEGSISWDRDRECPVVSWRAVRFGLGASPVAVEPGESLHMRFSLGTERPSDALPSITPAERAGRTVALGQAGPLSAWRLEDSLRPHPGLMLPPAGDVAPTPIRLLAPRGGSDTATIYLQGVGEAIEPSLAFHDLAAPDGTPLAAVTVEAARSLLIDEITDPLGALGPTAEVLQPLQPGDRVRVTQAGQGLLLTARVSRGAAAGVVSSEIIFTQGGQPPLRIPVALEVVDWTLPARPALRAVAEFYHWNLGNPPPEELHRWAAVFAANRMSPGALRAPLITVGNRGELFMDTAGFDEDLGVMLRDWDMNTLFLPHGLAGAQGQARALLGLNPSRRQARPLWRAYLRQMRAHLEERGWLDEAVLALWDEPNADAAREDVYEELAELAEAASAEAPGLTIYISTTGLWPDLESRLPPQVQAATTIPMLVQTQGRWPEGALRRRWLTLDGLERGWITGDLGAVRRVPRLAWAFGLEGIELWAANAWNDERARRPGLLDAIDTSALGAIGPLPAADLGGTLLHRDGSGRPLRSLTWVALGQGLEDVDLLRALEAVDPAVAQALREATRARLAGNGAASPPSTRWDRDRREEALRRLAAQGSSVAADAPIPLTVAGPASP